MTTVIKSTSAPVLEVRKVKRSYAIFAGVSQLSRKFKTAELAQAELNNSASFYMLWAGSASVAVDNSDPSTWTVIKV